MKIKSVLFVVFTMVIIACGSDDDAKPYSCSSCVDAPEALAANDNSGKGIYKGVVIGSSGTLKINMDNDGSGISAILVLDGEEIELETESTYNSEGGFEGYFVNDNDTETESDDYVIGFYVNASGTSLELFGIDFPSPHDEVTILIVKETSDDLIMAFEGTFSGDEEGTWNLMMTVDEDGDGQWAGIGRPDDGDSGDEAYFEGAIQDFTMVGGDDDGLIVTGSVDGDNIKGNWEVDGGGSGKWKGKRTL